MAFQLVSTADYFYWASKQCVTLGTEPNVRGLCIQIEAHLALLNSLCVKRLALSFRASDRLRMFSLQPYCSLHLHLHVSANPYTSGNIASRESAPGIIVASGGRESVLTFKSHSLKTFQWWSLNKATTTVTFSDGVVEIAQLTYSYFKFC